MVQQLKSLLYQVLGLWKYLKSESMVSVLILIQ